MPVMKMARLKLKIEKTSIAAAQHFMSLRAAALILDGVSVRVERRLSRGVFVHLVLLLYVATPAARSAPLQL